MTITYDDARIDEVIWREISTSSCPDDFRTYLRHALEQAAHADEALERLDSLDSKDAGGPSLYGQAFTAVLDLAESGDRTAQFQIGKMFENGYGTSPSREGAERWYRLAVLQDELRAHVNLALILADRPDDERACSEAIALLETASAAGETAALQLLARMYSTGTGVEKDLASVHELLLRAWELGDASAAFRLGQMHRQGVLGGDDEAGWEWIRKAAEAGDPGALTFIGYRFESEGDFEAAVPYFRRAALAGDDDAAKALGTLYLEGKGILRDGAEAVKWLRPAALRGHMGAQFNLATAYQYGMGVLPNRSVALKWMRRAAETNDGKALFRLAELTEEDDSEKANSLFAQAARQGHPRSQARLGLAYWRGSEAEKDTSAYKWFRLSALQNDPFGTYLMGWATQTGIGTEVDLEEAVRWFRKGASLGDVACKHQLGLAYLIARGVERDIAEAAYWLTQAAEQGSSDAERTIGLMFLYGDGVEEDAAEASRWLLAAAEKQNARAQFELGKLYAKGLGVVRSAEEATRWIGEAARLGDADAAAWIEESTKTV